jgi:hypothetical protein
MNQLTLSTVATERLIADAVAEAWKRLDGAPLMDAAEAVVRACMHAAILSPEWAQSVVGTASEELDRMAQRLIASNPNG